MRFLAPGWIQVAGIASAVVAAIHLIAWQLPRAVPLPTARFVPDEQARRAARTIRLSHLALLALRVAILMTAGFALARPVFEPAPRGAAHVIAVDAGADTTGLRNLFATLPPGGRTVFLLFDTTARVVSDEAVLVRPGRDGLAASALSTGLLAAIREARALARNYETVDITLVSPFDRHSFDEATLRIRATWPDSIMVIRVPGPVAMAGEARVEVAGDVDDPVVAGIRLAEANRLVRGVVRVNRTGETAADSAVAAAGAVAVIWPRADPVDSQRVAGVRGAVATAVGHFTGTSLGSSGQVVARWVDGTPAATERRIGNGCIRTVGFDVPDVGDFSLSVAFQGLVAEILAPCTGYRPGEVAPDSMIASIASPPAAASRRTAAGGSSGRLAAALMTLAVLLSIVEMVVRRGSAGRQVAGAAA